MSLLGECIVLQCLEIFVKLEGMQTIHALGLAVIVAKCVQTESSSDLDHTAYRVTVDPIHDIFVISDCVERHMQKFFYNATDVNLLLVMLPGISF